MAVVTVAPVIETPLMLLTPVAPVPVRLRLPSTVLIPAETVTFWPVRLTLDDPIKRAVFPIVILPAVALVKLTVRSSTKFAEDVPKLNEEFETVPLLSLMRIEAKPDG